MIRASPLAWRRPRREALVLALVSAVALSPMGAISPQDFSHFCLAQSLAHGHVTVDGCVEQDVDRAYYGAHYYSNKAPGDSVLAVPSFAAVHAEPLGYREPVWKLWVVRLCTSGVAFVVCCFLVGRVAEGLAPGWGSLATVAFGLGTLAAPFAASGFDHLPTAALAFAAFVLAWSRRPVLAGLSAGAAATMEYEAAVFVLLLGAYAAVVGGRALARFALGVIPGVAALAVYDAAAFGAPWHTAVSYTQDEYTAQVQSGVLGIRLPSAHSSEQVFVGSRGLLWISPVLAAAAAGLVLLWRRGRRAEVLVAAAVVLVFVAAECGYFAPYGGVSPGPRYLVPALPFLALGFAPAFAARPRAGAALTVLSVVPMTALTLIWPNMGDYSGSIWGVLARMTHQAGRARVAAAIAQNAFGYVGLHALAAAGLACVLAAASLAVALVSSPSRRPR